MMKYAFLFSLLMTVALLSHSQSAYSGEWSGNPLFPGWYADPEGTIVGDTYWIYPTYSDHYLTPDTTDSFSGWQKSIRAVAPYKPFLIQTFFNAFSSKDLVHWEKHSHVLDVKDISWAAYALWAPAIVEKDKRYYLFFSANDIKNNNQTGGIGVAIADNPAGPFTDYLDRPLIGMIVNGAQPIDQFVFHDVDGKYYMIYGGWKHCNICRLNDDFTRIIPFDDGSTFKSITPKNYVEGPFMFIRNGKYYLMWSEGDWTGPDYSVAYAISKSPFGPFKRVGKILQQDPTIATGAGHHSVINIPGTDDWYIIYHRRPLDTNNGNHRETCIEHMYFDKNGHILPVKMTKEGVEKRTIK
jgi:beta-xylosidase